MKPFCLAFFFALASMTLAAAELPDLPPGTKPNLMTNCVVSNEPFGGKGKTPVTFVHQKHEIKLCSLPCSVTFSNSPAKFLQKIEQQEKALAKGFRQVDVEEYEQLRKEKGYLLLDVRTAREFKAGHIPGAINLDVNDPEFDSKVAALDKTKPYLVNCAVGGRSAKACEKMGQLKFPALYNLDGGFKAWEKAGK